MPCLTLQIEGIDYRFSKISWGMTLFQKIRAKVNDPYINIYTMSVQVYS